MKTTWRDVWKGGGKMGSFVEALRALINEYSLENGSDTPDYILAEYLEACLNVFNLATNRRTDWYNGYNVSNKVEVSGTNVK